MRKFIHPTSASCVRARLPYKVKTAGALLGLQWENERLCQDENRINSYKYLKGCDWYRLGLGSMAKFEKGMQMMAYKYVFTLSPV